MVVDDKVYDEHHFCFIEKIGNGYFTIRDFKLEIIEDKPFFRIYDYELIQKHTTDINCKLFNYKNSVRVFHKQEMPFANTFHGNTPHLDCAYDEIFQTIQNKLMPPESQNQLDFLMDEMTPSFDTGCIPTSQLEYMVSIDTVSVKQLERQHGVEVENIQSTKKSSQMSKCSIATEFLFENCLDSNIAPEEPVYSQESPSPIKFEISETNATRIPSVITRPRKAFKHIEIPLLADVVQGKRKKMKIT